MRDATKDSVRSRQRAGRKWLAGICVAFVTSQIIIVTVVPPDDRRIGAGLLTTVTLAAVIVVTIEAGFGRVAVRGAEVGAPAAGPPLPPYPHSYPHQHQHPHPHPREQFSPLIQQAYYLAQRDAPAWYIAGRCEIPQAFAALIIDDVRRTATGTTQL